MQQIGASCPSCGLFHIHSDCAYREPRTFDDSQVRGEFESQDFSEGSNSSGLSRRSEYLWFGRERAICGSRVVLLQCTEYLHDYGKRLFCGREFCPRCGKDESELHKRRYARLMDKVFCLGERGKGHGLGYFVFTVPLQIRESLKSKSKLQRAGRFIRNLLKHHGFDVGVSRWHFFGSGEIKESEEIDLGEYHPHLNALCVGRWLYEKELKFIKESWRRYLEVLSGQSIDTVVVNYSYTRDKARWWHRAVYITRATFKSLEGNEKLGEALYGFRNIVFWGWGQGADRLEKLRLGKVSLGLWLDEEVMSRKEFDELVEVSQCHCLKCAEMGRGFVRIQTYMDSKGFRKLLDFEEILPRIECEVSGGFYVLKPIILKEKPMSLVEDDSESLENVYDTS
jgi:hypothetical protein